MSLFPAYSDSSKEAVKPVETEWLKNSSYPVKCPVQEVEEKDVEMVEIKPDSYSSKAKKRKKSKKKSKKHERDKEISKTNLKKSNEDYCEDNSDYFIDKTRQEKFLTVKTLKRPLRPRYIVKFYGLSPRCEIKKKKYKRYFKFSDSSQGYKAGTLSEETAVTKKTEEFNKKLTENPHEIQTWLNFVNFQDEFHKYQHIKYKSLIERERAVAQHKLSILDRAVTQNPDNKKLQALWLKIGTSVLPSEEMSSRINKILEDSGGTMTLWLGLMTTTQHSLARCTVPSVTKLYEKLLMNFQQVKQPDIYARDLNVLELLFHYGRFLDNCGHWEILWMMIKVNFQFNAKIEMNFDLKVDEKVKALENSVLEKEKQAVWQMWSKLERIREGLHFLPDPDSIDYPQRCVAPETVVNFTWHFHPHLHFQLIITFLLEFKVPLLSASDTVLKFLIPNALPWVFDSPEFVLSAVLTSPAVNLLYSYLSPVTQLTRGPQYLRRFHGQNEFLVIINSTFEACLKHLEGRQRTVLGVWWLRFERWIQLLNKLHLAFLPEDRKSAKNFFKDFLKAQENRDNLLFYVEYSLLEFNLGNIETCVKTLRTLILSRPHPLSMNDGGDKGVTTHAYRTLCEVLIGANREKEAAILLINLGNGNSLNGDVALTSLETAENKFELLSYELINNLESASCSLEDLLMPLFIVDWISCYFWFIALVQSPSELRNVYEKIFRHMEDKTGVIVDQTRECLWETLVTVFRVLEKKNYNHIREILNQSITTFPQNLKFLFFMADVNLQNDIYWWSLKKTFLSTPTIFSCVFLICLALDRFEKDKENFKNRVKNLFQCLALQDGKLSSMVHCLRLRFLFENDNTHLEVAQLQALESCPWNKSIYMESILLLPAKLMQLTDVLIEKELRIHITPDEIQEMRD